MNPSTLSFVQSPIRNNIRIALGLGSAICLLPFSPNAVSADVVSKQNATKQHYHIAGGQLNKVLTRFSAITGVFLAGNLDLTAGKTSPGLVGQYTIEEALNAILLGSELQAIKQGNGSYTLQPLSAVRALDKVTVTGQEVRFGDAPAEPGGLKAEYQTTATKMAMSLRETPQAISVVTRDSLDARMVRNLSTAIEITPSVSNSGNGVGIASGPGMFGGQGIYDEKFVLRGQPVAIRGDGFKIGNHNIDLAAYERVEVIKGPSGFYGQGSLGGFINMVRRRPQEEFDASISGEVGSFDTYRTEVDITGSLNDEGNLRGRLNFVYDDAGAFVEKLESQKVMIAPSIEAVISDKTRVLAQFLYQKDRFDANPGTSLRRNGDQIELIPVMSDPTTLYGNTGEKSKTDVSEFLLRVDHELSDSWLASLLIKNNRSTRDAINPNYVSVYSSTIYTYYGKDAWERDYWAGEVRLQGEYELFGNTHQLLVGLEHIDEFIDRRWGSLTPYDYYHGHIDTFNGDFASFSTATRNDIPLLVSRYGDLETRAVYAQTLLSIDDKNKLLIGGRYDKFRSTTKRRDGVPDPEPLTANAFTGKVGLIHNFNDNVTGYGIWAESFEPNDGRDENGRLLDPITGTGYELGLKTEWLDKKLGANLAIFYQELDNRPLNKPGETYQVASGKHLTKGIELEVSGSLAPGWDIAAALSLMDNKFTEDDDPYKGLSIDGSVDKQFSFYTNYEVQKGALKGLGIGATYVHVADRNFVLIPWVGDYSQIYLDGYDRWDLNFSYNAIPNWDMSLLIRNVTDETYIDSATFVEYGAYFGSPRAALFSATYNF